MQKGRISAALLVELPGIKAAHNPVDLCVWITGQHGATWGNMTRNENVLTGVSHEPAARRAADCSSPMKFRHQAKNRVPGR
jgi:hypothetical protein